MLTQLNIQGLAIIDSLSIEFARGFNVITGETGAGKSILIKALSLLLGSKASAETVRAGRELASVSGCFEVPLGHPCGDVLTNYGIDSETDIDSFSLLIRRTVNSKGRSFAWINDVPVTVAVLRELALTLIDVFGQHENLRLLDSMQHISCVDKFISDRTLPLIYADQYRQITKQIHNLVLMTEGYRTKQRDADYLAYRCNELRTFNPSREDYEFVQDLCRRANHMLALAKSLEEAQACVDQGAAGEPSSQPLWETGRILSRIGSIAPELGELSEYAMAVAAQVDDLSFRIGQAASTLEIDHADLEAAQTRLAGYQELFRKLSVADIEGLLLEYQRLEADLGSLESAAVAVEHSLAEIDRNCESLSKAASQLTEQRQQARFAVKRRIEAELHELAMPGARIDVELSPIQRHIPTADIGFFSTASAEIWARIAEIMTGLSEHGAEKAQLLLAPNPGEQLLPLQKIASGGEISRVMLSIKKALAAGANTCILVFDEIDTGISGRVAAVVGRKMRDLSTDFQVICISHLAQVAAHADAHYLVHKLRRDDRTESTISQLSRRESEEELARLLSGEEVTPSSLANAKALVRKARKDADAPVTND